MRVRARCLGYMRDSLASLTEMERENILNERYEARKKRLERMDLRRMLQQNKGTRTCAARSSSHNLHL
jgi:hypothetical protein